MAQWMHRHARLSHGTAKPLSSVFELAAGDTAARTVMQEWLSDGLKMQCDWAIRIVNTSHRFARLIPTTMQKLGITTAGLPHKPWQHLFVEKIASPPPALCAGGEFGSAIGSVSGGCARVAGLICDCSTFGAV